jgi:hypothetical protein
LRVGQLGGVCAATSLSLFAATAPRLPLLILQFVRPRLHLCPFSGLPHLLSAQRRNKMALERSSSYVQKKRVQSKSAFHGAFFCWALIKGKCRIVLVPAALLPWLYFVLLCPLLFFFALLLACLLLLVPVIAAAVCVYYFRRRCIMLSSHASRRPHHLPAVVKSRWNFSTVSLLFTLKHERRER